MKSSPIQRLSALIVLCLSVASCGTGSTNTQPQRNYHLEYSFDTTKNYQEVYRTIMNGVNSCARSLGASTTIAEGQLFTHLSAADIVIQQQSLLGKYPHINVHIDSKGETTTVNIKNDLHSWDDFAKVIKYWITDNLQPC
jgi:hypothetical protein